MKAVGYIRVSTDKVEQEGSLENQKTLFIQYIKERGFEFSGFYVDVDSGTKVNREGLNNLLRDAEDKKFDVIISKELSRLARNAELAYRIKRIAENSSIHIITLDGQVDTTDNSKQNMFGLYAWMYEQESARISSRIKSVFRSKMKEGKFLGSIPPYGYSITKEQSLIIRDDYTPLIVKEIYELFLKEESFGGIATHLNKKGTPTPATVAGKSNAGSYWHSSSIRLILTNPHYTGMTVQAREENISVTNKNRKSIPSGQQIVVEDTHEGIIDLDTFGLVQSIISKRKKKGKGKHKKGLYLFTNYLYCNDCGGTMKFVKSRSSYVCGKYHRHGNVACTSHWINEDMIVAKITDDLSKLANSIDNETILSAIKTIKSRKNQLDSDLKIVEKALTANNNRKEKLLDLLLADTIDESIYKLKMCKLTNEATDLEEKVLKLKGSAENDTFYSNERLIKEITEIKSFNKIDRNVLQKFVDKIYINDDKTFEVKYNFNL